MSDRTINRLMTDFSTYHQSARNQICHYFGIPIVSLAAIGIASKWTLLTVYDVAIDGGIVLLAGALLLDAVMHVRLALLVTLGGAALYLLATMLPLLALVALMVPGWAFQLVGHHVYERKNPAFTKNIVHLAVGPMWVMNQAFRIVR